jgi:hypothetical protein
VKSKDFDIKGDSALGFMGDIARQVSEVTAVQKQVSPETDPSSQITCRLGDASCAGAHASRLNRSTASKRPAQDSRTLLKLQRQYGNRFVQRVLDISAKSEEPSEVTPEVESAIQQSKGGGHALDGGVQKQMESSFKADFSGVRVHSDANADTLNQSLSSRAFTTGKDVFFKQGEYNPGSSGGRELLAHELTHVVQQNGDEVRTKLSVGQPGDRYEQEADSVARAVMDQEHRDVQRKEAEGNVRRQPEEEKDESLQTKADTTGVRRQAEDDEEAQAKR